LIDPLSGSGTVEQLVSVRNTSTQRVCYGISLSTSYRAGLQSFCVKPRSTGQYKQHGAAGDYRGGRISIFVTSSSRKQFIGAVKSSSKSPFTVLFCESLPVANLDFKVYSPTYFAGFHFTTFALTDGSACTDHSRSAFVLGGRGTFGNDYRGADIFERRPTRAEVEPALTPRSRTWLSTLTAPRFGVTVPALHPARAALFK
jgi:hypothetical protein